MARIETTPALSVTVFGEKTSLPIAITKAIIRSTDPIPFVQKASTSLQLYLTNATVEKDVSAKLQLTLPLEASVKKFELRRDDKWYPATAVPKQKGQAVVYKEKEKGRAVAAVSNSAATNIFEMEISPLPYKKEILCRLEVLTEGGAEELVESLRATNGAEVVVESLPTPAALSTNGGAVVGNCFGKTHFLCQVPSIPVADAATTKNDLRNVAVFWDTSASMKENADLRCSRLSHLLEKAGTETVELFLFGIGLPERVGTYTGSNPAELFQCINALSYDGGTDVTTLPGAIAKLAGYQHDKAVDAVLVFTDGVDNLGRSNGLAFGPSIPFPVHCIADKSAKVNLSALKAMAAASVTRPGVVVTDSSNDYLQSILFQQPVLQSILVDQSEDAFLEETDDGFSCVPDHRLKALNLPIPNEGLRICGTVGDSVTQLTARVLLGDQVHVFHYKIRNGESSGGLGISLSDETKEDVVPKIQYNCRTLFLESSEDNSVARILGHVYAEQLYREAEAFGIKSGLSTENIRQYLAISYGFCSPESTLLMLYEPEQFEEHGIRPPEGHPAAVDMALKRTDESIAYVEGEIGGLKTSLQRQAVRDLAERMQSFFTDKEIPKKGRVQQRQIRDGCAPRYLDVPAEAERATGRYMFGGHNRESSEGGAPRCGSFGIWNREGCEPPGGNESMSSDGAEEGCEDVPFGFLGGNDGCGDDEDYYCSGSGVPSPSVPRDGACGGSHSEEGSSGEEDKTPKVEPPKNLDSYIDCLSKAVSAKSEGDSWKKEYEEQVNAAGGHQSASPSLFLITARVLIRQNKPMEALRVATNCLETGLEDVQLLRSVGYVLLSSETEYGLNMAIDLFEKVRKQAPLEPQSYLDISMSRFWKSWKAFQKQGVSSVCEQLRKDLAAAQEGLVHVLTHKWASRFEEVEWPALVLLHYIRDFVRTINQNPVVTSKLQEWPSIFEGQEDSLCLEVFDPALMVWLGWDTDRTDLDLHVVEPSRREVYYGNKRGTGSLLSRDFTQGYGPEVYIARNGAADAGTYQVKAKYYASRQDSNLTGTTSVMVWVMEKKNGEQHLKFDFVRLDTHNQTSLVGTATIEGTKEAPASN